MEKNPLSVALKKLSYHSYSKKEMEKRLIILEYSKEEIADVVAKLLDWGYLNDSKLALYFYEYYTNIKPCGYFYIKNKLIEKGIPQEIIDSVLTNYDQDEEYIVAKRVSEKFLNNKEYDMSSVTIKGKLARCLNRKGFSNSTILKVLSDNFNEIS
ncbi:MAG: regulatory protein RecX [Clostridia bacterium]|nr:regulatory protein RecX [Clostridia bacterium]